MKVDELDDYSNFEDFMDSLVSMFPDSEMSVVQYDEQDCAMNVYTGTFKEVFGSIENPSSYYYRVAVLSQNTIRKRVAGHHFNVRTSCLGGLEFSIPEAINRYLNYAVRQYEKGWYFNFFSVLCHYVWYHDMLLYMKQLTNEGLNEQIEKLLDSFPGIYEIQDLNLYRKKAGIYILVLDKYHVCYIGQSNNITARIMRHWSRSDYYTGTGIDVFKAFDTTRIYVLPASEYKINQLEWEMVDAIDKQYVLNKFTGGTIDFHLENDFPLMIDEDGSIDNFFDTPLKASAIQDLFIIKNEEK